MKARIITIDTATASLKRKLRRHLNVLGYEKNDRGELVPPAVDKPAYRAAHALQRRDRIARYGDLICRRGNEFLDYFASGSEVCVPRIAPELERVRQGTWQSELFRFASLLWQIPVSEGFGRRMRFLVWDQHNHKLLGLLALGDPVFNLRARDQLVGWSATERSKSLVNILDAYVMGAIPPYNQILAGKLVACLLKTSDMVRYFKESYGDTVGVISKEKKRARLAMITTTSALGRSSVYNRLRIDGEQYLESIGFTTGFGHFHIPDDLFEEMRAFLRKRRDPYASNHRFGQGPSWRMRAIRKAISSLGMNPGLIQHGFQREVFICRTASNALDVLAGRAKRPNFSQLKSLSSVADACLARWVRPRAERDPRYREWNKSQVLDIICDAEMKKRMSSSRAISIQQAAR
jgi:hypothetical protein